MVDTVYHSNITLTCIGGIKNHLDQLHGLNF